MSDELIRPILRNDLAAYRSLLDACFSQGPGREETRAALLRMARIYSRAFPLIRTLNRLGLLPRSVPRVYVCVRNGELAGAICVRRTAPGAYYVVHIAVAGRFRRSGVASRLRDFAVSQLPAEPGLRLLARHRILNQPQARNAAKFGYRPYLHEFSLGLTGDRLPAVLARLAPGGSLPKCRPANSDFRRLRAREIPEEVLRLDPSLGEAGREGSRVMRLFDGLAVHRRRTSTALERNGEVAGLYLVSYHRLQRTHDAEFALNPDVDAAFVEALARDMVESLIEDAALEVRIRIWEFQPTLRQVLLGAGFQELVERVLVCRPLHNRETRLGVQPQQGPEPGEVTQSGEQ